jgi:hypothetical protein
LPPLAIGSNGTQTTVDLHVTSPVGASGERSNDTSGDEGTRRSTTSGFTKSNDTNVNPGLKNNSTVNPRALVTGKVTSVDQSTASSPRLSSFTTVSLKSTHDSGRQGNKTSQSVAITEASEMRNATTQTAIRSSAKDLTEAELSKLGVSENLSPTTPNGERSSAMLRSSTTKSGNQSDLSGNSTVPSLSETKGGVTHSETTSREEPIFSTTSVQMAGNSPGTEPTKAESLGSMQTVLDGKVTPALSTPQKIGNVSVTSLEMTTNNLAKSTVDFNLNTSTPHPSEDENTGSKLDRGAVNSTSTVGVPASTEASKSGDKGEDLDPLIQKLREKCPGLILEPYFSNLNGTDLKVILEDCPGAANDSLSVQGKDMGVIVRPLV